LNVRLLSAICPEISTASPMGQFTAKAQRALREADWEFFFATFASWRESSCLAWFESGFSLAKPPRPQRPISFKPALIHLGDLCAFARVILLYLNVLEASRPWRLFEIPMDFAIEMHGSQGRSPGDISQIKPGVQLNPNQKIIVTSRLAP